jgi:K+-sensing histidine kinase KdpD
MIFHCIHFSHNPHPPTYCHVPIHPSTLYPPLPTPQVTQLVIDKGIGITPEDQEKIWIPIALIRPGDAQEGRGSGLGVPLAREIVGLHGGDVFLESEPGEGSTFSFSVPLRVVPFDEKQAAQRVRGG